MAVRWILGVLAVSSSPAWAADWTVTTTGDAHDARPTDGICADATGACTARAAFETAAAHAGPDRVLLPAGTFRLPLGPLTVATELVVRGAGPTRTVLVGVGARVIDHTADALVLRALTLREGTADAGGCLRSIADTAAASLDVRDVAFRACTATSGGGGLWVAGGMIGRVDLGVDARLERVIFAGNHGGTGPGGALIGGRTYYPAGRAGLTDVAFVGNDGEVGALLARYTTAVVNVGVFERNRSGRGAIVRGEDGHLTLKGVRLTGNVGSALLSAGGPSQDFGGIGADRVLASDNTLTSAVVTTDDWAWADVVRSVIRDNVVGDDGAVLSRGVHATRVTIAGNHFTGSGAVVRLPWRYAAYGWALSQATLFRNTADDDLTVIEGAYAGTRGGTIAHVTAVGNRGDRDGDGIGGSWGYRGDVAVTLSASVFTGNQSGEGECVGAYTPGAPNLLATVDPARCTAVAPDDLWGVPGQPLDAGLETPVLTPSGQLVLAPRPDGPLVDAAVGSASTVDQLGRPRSLDGDGDGDAVPDIGAIELDP